MLELSLIFHMSIPKEKTFPWVSKNFWPCGHDRGVWPIFDNFTLANNFLTVSARAYIFYMSVPCVNVFDT